MTRTTAVVLAGGASRRMGSDKRSLRLFPTSPTFLARTVAVGRAVAGEVVVIGDPSPGVRASFLPDRWPHEGPLGALVTALEAFPADVIVALAGDYPMLQVGLLARLLDGLDGYDASVAVAGGRRHPLVAAYDAVRCAGIAGSLFGAGERSMAALVGRLSARLVGAGEVGDSGRHGLALTNVNTPEALHALREGCRASDRKPL